MRKFAFIYTLLALAVFCASSSWAAGRLNFMLINHTGHEIVDTKIFPTYFPKYESENLLKTGLEPNSRIYIGPNYYGEQKYWTIAVKWANGYERAFPKMSLTRYNTYTLYSTPEGVKIRQSYEKGAAGYEFGPDVPSYMGLEPDVSVKATAPEKLGSPAPQITVVEPGKAANKPSPKNLTFADVPANTLAMKTTVEMTRDGQTNTVTPSQDFKAGDKVRLLFSTNKDGHVYWVGKNPAGQYTVVFPNPGMDNTVVANKEYSLPARDPLQFDEKGVETFMAILSPTAVADLDKAVQLAAEGKLAESSKLIENVVNNHEQKRTGSEIVFEEEDDEDVNTQSQIADGEYPFVGTYELSHE